MRELDFNEIRTIQLNILKEFHNYCKENNLKYSLGGGTLLGAIRHKGFIPWDDDIDVIMPRPDYLKLIKEYNNKKREFKLFAFELNENFTYPFAKLSAEKTLIIEYNNHTSTIGINIDIFPIDGVPNSIIKTNFLFQKIKLFRNILDLKMIKSDKERSWYKEMILLLFKFIFTSISTKLLTKKIISYSQKYKFNNSKTVACLVWGYGKNEICSKNIYDIIINVHFEDEKFNIIIGYHEYLQNLYGNYLELPPKNKQISHHKFQAYIK